MEGDQVTPQGDQGNVTPDANQSLGWRAALPDEFKEHDFVKTFTKPGDFVKSALEIKTEHDALKTKLEGAIFKPDDKATPEAREAFYRSLGKPEKATEYEFPKGEGVEHDPKLTEWAQGVFHAANLSKDQAAAISQAWDGFIQGMAKADADARTAAVTEAQTALKTEWGADYEANTELARRAFKKFADTELTAFLDETKVGNSPVMLKAFAKIGRLMGDDTSLPGGQPRGESIKVGMNYTTMDNLGKGG